MTGRRAGGAGMLLVLMALAAAASPVGRCTHRMPPPLVFLPGEGTELYRGVGAIVLFGLMGAAIVTVTFLPALAIVVLSMRNRAGPDETAMPSLAR
ncbi:hypothetical protein LPB19_04665 [Marinobacter salinisoli]|uniref:Uncharacterized protein n=1 Tax=Marinobacter salinisoli TaxID=2769486 RepID=A0ABX7MX76_9GAMM|nr:hypothetical protein [Marinobacter salinisoli]QSP95711.1 hypothetical protein LPB19_04665 [Marinobacter salinisoli]